MSRRGLVDGRREEERVLCLAVVGWFIGEVEIGVLWGVGWILVVG